MEKGTLKNILKNFKIGFITFAATLTIVTGASAIYGNVSLADYSNNKEINYIARELDCDTGYIFTHNKKYIRMQHNNKEPIYVSFSSKMSQEEVQCATNSLNYLFGIVGKINDNYRFEIVDKDKFDDKKLKSRIYFDVSEKSGEENMPGAFVDSNINSFSRLTPKRTTYYSYICRNKNYQFDDLEHLQYAYNHELLHAFGIEDVYTTNTTKYQGNTFIQPNIGRVTGEITPNDLKCLIALYSDKLESDNEKQEKLSTYKTMVKEYEDYYYHRLSSEIVKDLGLSEAVDMEKVYWQGQGRFVASADGSEHIYNYKIKLEGNSYVFKILNKDFKVIETYQGELINSNGVVILKDLELKEGITPGIKGTPDGYIQDYVLIKQNGVVNLVDISNYNMKIYGFASKNDLMTELE